MKETLLSSLKIAEINFLMSFKELKPENVTKQVMKDTNHIAWIIGHCVSHFDAYLTMFTGQRLLSPEEEKYHEYGAKKNEIIRYPFSFSELIDKHLKISQQFFDKLEKLPSNEFNKVHHEEAGEKLSDMIQRITLHIMGHTGQIVLIRRMLNDPFWSFVGGVHEEQRKELREKWISWWEKNREKYS